MSSQLEPITFEIAVGTQRPQSTPSQEFFASFAGLAFHVYMRFASLPAVVDAQIAQATAALNGCVTSIEAVDGDVERALWDAHATGIWDQPGAVVRASWLPANIASGLAEIDRITAGLKACTTSTQGRAAVGAGLIRIDGNTAEQATAIEQLRASSVFGNVVIVRGSAELKARVDVWGSHGSRQPLFDSLKRAFDPNNVLNAGRGPL